MVDLGRRRGLTLDADALARRLGVPVVPIVARSGHGHRRLASTRCVRVRRQRPADLPAAGDVARGARPPGRHARRGARHARRGPTRRPRRADRAARRDPHASRARPGRVRRGHGGAVLDAVRAGGRADGSHRGDVRQARQRWSRRTLPGGPLRDLVAHGIIGGIAGTVVFLPQICLLFFLISLLEDTGYLARAAFVMDRLLAASACPATRSCRC